MRYTTPFGQMTVKTEPTVLNTYIICKDYSIPDTRTMGNFLQDLGDNRKKTPEEILNSFKSINSYTFKEGTLIKGFYYEDENFVKVENPTDFPELFNSKPRKNIFTGEMEEPKKAKWISIPKTYIKQYDELSQTPVEWKKSFWEQVLKFFGIE